MSIILSTVALILSIIFFGLTFQFPSLAADPGGPALFPRSAAVLTGAAAALHLLETTIKGEWKIQRAGLRGALGEGLPLNREKVNAAAMIACVLLYPAAIYSVGFLGATGVFVLLLLLLSGIRPVQAVATTVIAVGAIYGAYVYLLGAVLPSGALLG